MSDALPMRPVPEDPSAFVDLTSLPADVQVDDRAWSMTDPFPTSLIGLWPGTTLPSVDEVTRAFAEFIGEAVIVIEDIAPEDDSIRWSRVLSVPGLASPVIIWGEAARSFGPDDLPAGQIAPQLAARIANARWVIGCESLLSEQAPLNDFIALMRLLAGSFSAMPAVLDAMTRQWFQREEIESLFLSDEPAATEEVLWRVHAIGHSEQLGDDDRVWLYTVGLWRCGKPELEILELPGRHVSGAVTLLNGIASLALNGPLPVPDAVAVIGENLRVAFRPWQEVVPYLDPESVGTIADRAAAEEPGVLNPLMGVRAVVCDAEPKGTYRKIWSWPERAIRQLEEDRAAIYLSERSTHQHARIARLTWPDFATAFVSVEQTVSAAVRNGRSVLPPPFLVKAAFGGTNDAEDRREHLWFEVRRLQGDSVEATLINSPRIATHLSEGTVLVIGRNEISDWRVLLPEGGYDPRRATALLAAIDTYRSAIAG